MIEKRIAFITVAAAGLGLATAHELTRRGYPHCRPLLSPLRKCDPALNRQFFNRADLDRSILTTHQKSLIIPVPPLLPAQEESRIDRIATPCRPASLGS